MCPPVKKWRHSESKSKLRNFENSLLFAELIMLCKHVKKYKMQRGVYEKIHL